MEADCCRVCDIWIVSRDDLRRIVDVTSERIVIVSWIENGAGYTNSFYRKHNNERILVSFTEYLGYNFIYTNTVMLL